MTRKSLSRREFLRLAGSAAAIAAVPSVLFAQRAADAPGRKPNIVLIFADDLGYADLGCQEMKDIPTPHIDSLAAAGVRFTNGYVSCPVCSPTRAGLMTGRYQTRFGHEFNPGPELAAADEFGLPLTEKTLADRLKARGYATGMVGKWHLGYKAAYHPQKRGFDEFFGFLAGGHAYRPGRGQMILRGNERVVEKEYLTDAFTREAVAFIDRHKDAPFFLYLPYNAVHSPMQASGARWDRFAHIEDRLRRTYATMLAAMDDGVGAVLAKLRDAGLEKDTLVFFISDNGGPTEQTSSRNDPLRGFKGQVFEGGIRIPFLVQWKGRLPAGKVCDDPVISLDVVPTVMSGAGAPVGAGEAVDGVDLLGHLTGKTAGRPHERLFWRYGLQSAVREGDWKAVRTRNDPVMLFNLADDVGEKTDLAAKNPDKLKELVAAYDAWNAGNIESKWRRGAGARRPAQGPRRNQN